MNHNPTTTRLFLHPICTLSKNCLGSDSSKSLLLVEPTFC